MRTTEYKVLYNSTKAENDIECSYDTLSGRFQIVKGDVLEYLPYEKMKNDGNASLARCCFKAKDEADEFVGWHIRIKHDNVWYWYLEDGTLIPRKFYLKENSKLMRKYRSLC